MKPLSLPRPLSLALVATVAACGTESPTSPAPFVETAFQAQTPGSSFVRVCKLAREANAGRPDDGTLGESFSFLTEADGGSVLMDESAAVAVTLKNYNRDVDCPLVWENPGVADDQQTVVQVTEELKAGFALAEVSGLFANGTFATVQVDGNTASVVPGTGVYLYFKNFATDEPPPPPPPGGGQGCTPGYWKQPHHYDSWVGYAPTDIYSDVFGVGPGIPLSEAVGLKGGKFNALTRHSVAALLNATSPGVDYDLSVAAIIAGVQEAYATGEWRDFKNHLDELNNQGCLLD